MINKLHRAIYYSLLKPSTQISPKLMVWACRHLKGIHSHHRLRNLYQYGALVRPQYYLGVRRAFQHAKRLNLNAFSVVEFGVAEGNGMLLLQNILMGLQKAPGYGVGRVKLIGYDTFEGLPEIGSYRDGMSTWKTGDYPADLEKLRALMDPELVHLEAGLFSDAVPRTRALLESYPPLFIVVDCDLYQSTKSIFESLFPDLVPALSYWYFDDTNLNSYSSRVGERLAIHEFNKEPGNEFEFVPDYQALDEPLPGRFALQHLYNCINSLRFRDHTRINRGIQTLPLDPATYQPI